MIKRNAIKARKGTEKQVWKQINTKINEAINSGNFHVNMNIPTKEYKSIVEALENDGYIIVEIYKGYNDNYICIRW